MRQTKMSDKEYWMNMDDNDIYPSYCKHNNPIYYQAFCPGCRIERENQMNQKYQEYLNRKGSFNPYTLSFEKDDELEESPKEFANLKRSNSKEELKKEYFKLARKHHPDKNGNEEIFKKLQNLYEKLKQQFNI